MWAHACRRRVFFFGFVTPLGVWKAASHSSEIRLHPNGRYLYVGNRGHDSICVLAIDDVDGGVSGSCGGRSRMRTKTC